MEQLTPDVVDILLPPGEALVLNLLAKKVIKEGPANPRAMPDKAVHTEAFEMACRAQADAMKRIEKRVRRSDHRSRRRSRSRTRSPSSDGDGGSSWRD